MAVVVMVLVIGYVALGLVGFFAWRERIRQGPRVALGAGPSHPVAMMGTEMEIDATLIDSFPASDPPSWVPGRAFVRPAATRPAAAVAPDTDGAPDAWLVRAARHTRSWLMAIGLAMLVPVGVLVLPIALAARALLDATNWRLVRVWK